MHFLLGKRKLEHFVFCEDKRPKLSCDKRKISLDLEFDNRSKRPKKLIDSVNDKMETKANTDLRYFSTFPLAEAKSPVGENIMKTPDKNEYCDNEYWKDTMLTFSEANDTNHQNYQAEIPSYNTNQFWNNRQFPEMEFE